MFHMITGLFLLLKQDPMEKDFSPWDLYEGVTEDSMIHAFELVMTYYQLYSQIQGTSSHQK